MVRIAVAGAGIGGLAAALALAKVGAQVTVLERRPAPAEFGAGLQLSPNATRVLRQLGLLDRLAVSALEPRFIRLRRGRDATDIVRFPLGAHAIERYGAPFLLILRPELQRSLAEAAAREPAIRLRFAVDVRGAAVTSPRTVTIDTSAGDLSADGFIDARGVDLSKARRTGRVAWRALVQATHLIPADLQPETNLWLGHRAHLVHYPVPGFDRINVVAITEEFADDKEADADLWSSPGDPSLLRRAFAGWHSDALRLLHPGAEWRKWPLFDGTPSPRWSHGPRTRVGDAAHPMSPFLAQGASQAIEDAGALASCFAKTADPALGFAEYEARRRARATRVQEASRRQADIYHLGRPASYARDLTLRLLGGTRALARMDWLYAPS